MRPLRSRRAEFAAILGFALTVAVALSACAKDPTVIIDSPEGKQLAAVSVEVANRPDTRELGLMYRQYLDQNAGMIFVFTHPEHQTFWMKNTEIPLDMIFADENGKVLGIAENAAPFTETSRAVDGESLYVLEVNGGFSERHHLAPGDVMKFSGFDPHSAQ